MESKQKLWSYIGLTNRLSVAGVEYRALFLDYDFLSYEQVCSLLYDLSSRYRDLSTWCVIESRPKHFWAVNFSILDFLRWEEILKDSLCDKKYIEHSLKQGFSAIRLSKHYNLKKNNIMFKCVIVTNTIWRESRTLASFIDDFLNLDARYCFKAVVGIDTGIECCKYWRIKRGSNSSLKAGVVNNG